MKIKNLVVEFLATRDKEAASEAFVDICQQNDTQSFMVAGYILNNSFSQDKNNWNMLSSLIVDYLFI